MTSASGQRRIPNRIEWWWLKTKTVHLLILSRRRCRFFFISLWHPHAVFLIYQELRHGDRTRRTQPPRPVFEDINLGPPIAILLLFCAVIPKWSCPRVPLLVDGLVLHNPTYNTIQKRRRDRGILIPRNNNNTDERWYAAGMEWDGMRCGIIIMYPLLSSFNHLLSWSPPQSPCPCRLYCGFG